MAIDEATLAAWVVDARRRTVALYADLGDAELAVPYLRIINPPVWELGHVAWFQEHWILTCARQGCSGCGVQLRTDTLNPGEAS